MINSVFQLIHSEKSSPAQIEIEKVVKLTFLLSLMPCSLARLDTREGCDRLYSPNKYLRINSTFSLRRGYEKDTSPKTL